MRKGSWFVLLVFAIALSPGGEAVAGKGGNGGGGGKPGGGDGTPPDPAIAYVEWPDLMVMDADGSNASVLVPGAASSAVPSIRPHWSPDGQWVVFNSADEGLGGPGVYVASLDGLVVKKVASTTQLPHNPNWSPVPAASGNHLIVFQAYEPYEPDNLYLLQLDPTTLDAVGAPTAITSETDVYSDGSPTWAPDGRTIAAFHHPYGAGDQDLVVYRLDESLAVTGPVTKVTGTGNTWGVAVQELDFANTSNTLAMLGRVGNDYDLYTLELGSDPLTDAPGALVNITNNTVDDELHPSWSPDDTRIAFARNAPRNKNDGIEVIDATGGNQTRLIKGPTSGLDWRP